VAAFFRKDGYTVSTLGAGCKAGRPDRYPRKRDELWFPTAEKARAGLVNLSRLDRAILRRLKQQLLAPQWDVDAAGRRAVEPKDKTKEKIGRSPDDADAMLLAYHDAATFEKPPVVDNPRPRLLEQRLAERERGGGRTFFDGY
jgi:hypothetical protein